ncbi:MAG: hypothetical protein GY719_34010 [bacterium]|nr:hypothetical protein [bacterium]
MLVAAAPPRCHPWQRRHRGRTTALPPVTATTRWPGQCFCQFLRRDPLALRRVAREAVNILTDPGFTTPEPQVLGLWEKPDQYAEQIEDLLEPFQTSLDEIESQKREVEKALKAKTDLLEELRDRLTWSIRLFEAIYRLADLGFHADRLRLTVSSRPRPEAAAEESVARILRIAAVISSGGRS